MAALPSTFVYFICWFAITISATDAQLTAVPQGCPAQWMGDIFYHSPCQLFGSGWPSWLDGYFFCQSSGSYGNQADPYGEKLIHMYDGIGALALFDLNPVQNTFTAKYYPTRSFKIWDFNNRQMNVSKVAWSTLFSPINYPAAVQWAPMGNGYMTADPDVDFWKIGNDILAGTEIMQVRTMLSSRAFLVVQWRRHD